MSRRSTAVLVTSLCITTVAFAAEPTFTSNLVKYRDTSKPRATGRSGNATIDALAMIGKDGRTALTIDANGTLEKVLIQPAGGSAINANNLGARSFAQQLASLAPHLPLHLQANISAVDGSRTDVVSADEVIKYRPDLAVTGLRAPERAAPGVPFEVNAVVRELNGDLGARANCVLSADGVEIDRAAGIWIDASDSVACKFSATLNSMGAHALSVTAEGAEPGDWDEVNNAASVTVTIAEPFDYYVAGALESNAHTHRLTEAEWAHVEENLDQWTQWSNFYGMSTKPMNAAALRMTFDETSDGAAVSHFDSGAMQIHYSYGWTNWDGTQTQCAYAWDDNTTMTACVWNQSGGTALTQFQVDRSSTAVTYVSRGWDATFLDENGNPQSRDRYSHYELGQQTEHFGSSVAQVATLTDGVSTLQAAPVIQLAPFTRTRGWRYDCFEDDWGRGWMCSENWTVEQGKRGVNVEQNRF
jgi:hypothetical protein